MVYLPVSFNPAENFPMLQRAYYAAQALGVADKAHDAMYDAVWKSGELSSLKAGGQGLKPASALPTIEDAAKVYAKFGADPKEFVAVAQSFTVNTKMKRADDLVKAYGVESTPTMVVNGKYRYTVSDAGGYSQSIELAQWLERQPQVARVYYPGLPSHPQHELARPGTSWWRRRLAVTGTCTRWSGARSRR